MLPDDLSVSARAEARAELTRRRPGSEPVGARLGDVEAAARAALARAKAAARARGLRPGQTGATAAKLARRRAWVAGQGRFSGAAADARDPQLFGDDDGPARRRARLDRRRRGRWGGRALGRRSSAPTWPRTSRRRASRTGCSPSGPTPRPGPPRCGCMTPTLLRRLAEELGEGVVERVTVAGPVGPSWRKGMRRVPGRGPARHLRLRASADGPPCAGRGSHPPAGSAPLKPADGPLAAGPGLALGESQRVDSAVLSVRSR